MNWIALSIVLGIILLLAVIALLVWRFPKVRKQLIPGEKKKAKSEVEKKKERARELYYRRLYEEVTKFNISIDDLDYEGFQMLADSHGKIGNKEEALKLYAIAFNKAEQHEDDFEKNTIIKDKARTLFQMGFFDDTIEALREYPNELLNEEIMFHDDYSVVSMLGNSFFKLGEYNAAIETYRRADKSKNFSKEILYSLAKAYETKGGKQNIENALRYYERIHEVDRGFSDVNKKIKQLRSVHSDEETGNL